MCVQETRGHTGASHCQGAMECATAVPIVRQQAKTAAPQTLSSVPANSHSHAKVTQPPMSHCCVGAVKSMGTFWLMAVLPVLVT